MKVAFYIFAAAFLISTVFVAPFVQDKKSIGDLSDMSSNNSKLQKQMDDKSPKLNGFINRFMIADEPGTTNSLIFFEVTVGNSGGSPSTADYFRLKVNLSKNLTTNAEEIYFSDEYKFNFRNQGKQFRMDLKRPELIAEKTHKYIQPGESPRGWIAFRLLGVSANQYTSTNIVLSFMDINDKVTFVTNGVDKTAPHRQSEADALTVILPGSDKIIYPIEQTPPTNTEWLPPELPPGCSNVVIFFGANGMGYSRFMAGISSEEGTKIDIKDVPDFFLTNYESLPNYDPSQPDMWLKYSTMLTIGGKTIPYPVHPIIISNRLFIEVEIPFSNEKHKLVMSDSFDTQLHKPRLWDRNFSTNYYANGLISGGIYAYEVVNELKNPVLQVGYAAPNEVHVNGIFQVDSNSILAAFGQQPQLITFTINDQNQTNGEMTASLQVENFHETLLIHSNETIASFGQRLTNEFFRPIFKNQRQIFKYPSNRKLGGFEDRPVETNNNTSVTNIVDKPQ